MSFYSDDKLTLDAELQRLSKVTQHLSFPSLTGARPNAQGTYSVDMVVPKYNVRGWYLETINCAFAPSNVAQTNLLFYTVTAFTTNTSGVGSALTLTPLPGTTDATTKLFNTLNAFRPMDFAVGVVLPTTTNVVTISVTVTGAAGNYYFASSLSYRLVL